MQYGQGVTQETDLEIAQAYDNLETKLSLKAHDGQIHVTAGKDYFEYSFYRWANAALYELEDVEFIFFKAAFNLQWSLVCREGNAVSICLSHIRWDEDALVVYFAHQKTDQKGRRVREPRHIFANPLDPAICPILTLGLYCCVFPRFVDDQDHLFSGSRNQKERYSNLWRKFLDRPNVKQELQDRGMQAENLGTQSTRKGSESFLSGGTTAGCSDSAINIRAGRSNGSTRDRYEAFGLASDRMMGRLLAGLPHHLAEFCILPPFFTLRDEVVKKALAIAFPFLPASMNRVKEFLLASIVYHRR